MTFLKPHTTLLKVPLKSSQQQMENSLLFTLRWKPPEKYQKMSKKMFISFYAEFIGDSKSEDHLSGE